MTTWREELAWAAGFMDGEGHFGLHLSKAKANTRAYGTVQLTAAQKDRRVLDRLQCALGVGKVYGPYKHGAKPTKYYGLYCHKFEGVQSAVAKLWPFLSPVKRAQAKQALFDYAAYCKRPRLRMGPKPTRKNGEQSC